MTACDELEKTPAKLFDDGVDLRPNQKGATRITARSQGTHPTPNDPSVRRDHP